MLGHTNGSWSFTPQKGHILRQGKNPPTFTHTIKDLSELKHRVNQVDQMKNCGVMYEEKFEIFIPHITKQYCCKC